MSEQTTFAVGDHVHWKSRIGISHGTIKDTQPCTDDSNVTDYGVETCDGIFIDWMHEDELLYVEREER